MANKFRIGLIKISYKHMVVFTIYPDSCQVQEYPPSNPCVSLCLWWCLQLWMKVPWDQLATLASDQTRTVGKPVHRYLIADQLWILCKKMKTPYRNKFHDNRGKIGTQKLCGETTPGWPHSSRVKIPWVFPVLRPFPCFFFIKLIDGFE